jgi:cytochrome d ubiquinol oxidase subunit I
VQTLDLARLQFALTAGAHFLFVALTLGLATLVAIIQTRATIGRDPVHERMTRFWGQLYIINYAMGIVTGLVMEFQFGLSWSGVTRFAGNTFGASLAMETLVAFFIESTFLGLWIFGWNRLNRWAHLGVIWVVTLTAYVSAYWILVSNGFLNHPVGAVVSGGVMKLTDAAAVLTNSSALVAFGHIIGGALLVGGFFMAGVSAYHLRRRTEEQEFFRKSLRIGIGVALPALLWTAAWGGIQFQTTGEAQPMKLAVWGDKTAEIARLQAEMTARFGPGDYVPPAGWVHLGGDAMLQVFIVMLVIAVLSLALMSSRRAVMGFRAWHLLLIIAIPLPFVSMIGGWVFREMGRQPWVVYGLLKTSDAVSGVSPAAMRLSLIVFTTVIGCLICVNYWLLARQARRGPAEVALGRPVAPETPDPMPVPVF